MRARGVVPAVVRGTLPLALVIAFTTQNLWAEMLEPKEAFEMLRMLNVKKNLFGMKSPKIEYMGLDPGNCFGLRLPGRARVAGESAGRPYGMSTQDGGAMILLIGFLYSEAPFVLEGNVLKNGAYSVFASENKLSLMGAGRASLPLPSKLDAALLEERGTQRPRFSLIEEGGEAFLVIGENKLAFKLN